MDKTKGRGRQKGARSIGRRMSQNRKIKEGKPKANILGYHNKKLLEIVNRNDHFQNCGS